ncbi:MAG: hypothetical protein FWE63_07815 [Bacteroidales bacterium]|nr:hypothetical protein [Bacteroidales bacterium]
MQHILTDYSQMSVDSLIELKNLIEDYPYCQTAQILYLLNLRRLEEDTFDTRLPYTAICVNNRQRLKCAVEQVDEILAKGKSVKYEVTSTPPLDSARGALSHRSLSGVETTAPRIQHQATFRNKTISELLNLQEPKPSAVTQIKLPKTQTSEDFLLEQLRQETMAKVNERLLEIRKTEMVDVNFSETPKHKALIDKVIATNPKISKMDESRLSHWKIKEENSMRENFDVTSETLALLYVAQGAPEKAREIYKALGKKYPEKAEHFTHLSKQIKSTKTTNTINSKSNNHKPKTKK